MKRTLLVGFAAAALCLPAAEYFVDAARPDNSGDGLSEATAKRTIQAAVDAAEADATLPRIVTVLPGTYAEGGKVENYACDQTAYKGQTLACTNRVLISKALTLRAKNPSELTEIVGSRNPSSSDFGIGPSAVRCVLVATDERVYVKGFTIRDGAAHDDNTRTVGGYWPTYAGGVARKDTNHGNFFVVDCTISHCSGRRGSAATSGKFVRCRLCGNTGSTVNDSVALHSVLCDQREAWFGQYVQSGGSLYNCTVFRSEGNGSSGYFSDGGKIVNSLVFGCTPLTYGSGAFNMTNSVTSCEWTGSGTKDDVSICGSSDGYYRFKSPLDGDWSLRSDSSYLTLGDAAHIAALNWPDEVEPFKDLDGNTLPTSGAIAPGCTQKTFTPVCGPIVLWSRRVIVDGTRRAFSGAYFHPEEKFAQHRLTVVLDDGEYLHSWNELYGSWRRFPAVDDSLMVMPPPDIDTRSSNTPLVTKQAFWVSPSGNDETGDGSEDSPFKTLLHAGLAAKTLAATSGNDTFVVHAAAGTYDEGSTNVSGGLTRVWDFEKDIRFLGAGAYGEGKSVIAGALDPDVSAGSSAYGRGPKAVRCGVLSKYESCFQNFELRDGRVPLTDGAVSAGNQGGGIRYGALIDCHVVNCGAARGGVAYYGRIERCRVTKPDPIPGARPIEDEGYAVSCIFEDQVGQGGNYSLTDSRPYVQCTLYPYPTSRGIGSGATIFNCLSTAANGPSDSWNFYIYGFVAPFSIPNPVSGTPVPDYKYANAQFADYANGDYRLLSSSPAIGYGSLRSLSSRSDDSGYWKTYGPDINGNKILFFDGKPLPGAVQEIVQAVTVTAATYGTMVPTGTTFIEPGESLTVSLTDACRPPRGLVVDGVETNVTSVTLAAPASPTGTIAISSVFGTNWYANASMPDDSLDGFTPETAKKTLISLCTNANLIAGDVIHAAPGDYNEGAYSHNPGSCVIRSRAIVKGNVTVVGDGGQDVTFITGAPAEGTSGGSSAGCGDTAIRCAYGAANGVLRGFTLRDGYTDAKNSTSTTFDSYGGGYLGADASARICDCTITNCYGGRSPLCHGGTYYGCSLMGDNKAIGTGFDGNNGGYFGGFYNCRIITSSNFAIMAPFVNCILCNKSTASSAGYYQIYASAANLKKLKNCIFTCSIRNTETSADNFYPSISNNIVCTGFGGTTPSAACRAWFKILTSAKIGTAYNTTDLSFKGTKSAYFCDAGVNIASHTNGTDIAGNQRIYNRIVDLGPAEYDWRPDFAAAIGAGATVTAASLHVTTNGLGKVRLADGASITVAPPASAGRMSFTVEDGTLAAKGGRRDLDFTTDGTYSFRAGATLAFAFLGDGFADLTGLNDPAGFMFLLK